eukprot:scaffold1668_cov288-Pavlova_lutheri.AAC.1
MVCDGVGASFAVSSRAPLHFSHPIRSFPIPTISSRSSRARVRPSRSASFVASDRSSRDGRTCAGRHVRSPLPESLGCGKGGVVVIPTVVAFPASDFPQ